MKIAACLALAMIVGAITVAGCSSESKLGESCDESGKQEDECESGSICGQQTGGALQCLKVCAAQSDCPADQECNGVEGSSAKGCRLKSDTSTSGGKK
jgi:hypothetical protein